MGYVLGAPTPHDLHRIVRTAGRITGHQTRNVKLGPEPGFLIREWVRSTLNSAYTTAAEFLVSCKSQPSFLVAHFDIGLLYSLYVWIVYTPWTCMRHTCSSSILWDDTACRDPVYCIAHTLSTPSTSPVGIHRYMLKQ